MNLESKWFALNTLKPGDMYASGSRDPHRRVFVLLTTHDGMQLAIWNGDEFRDYRDYDKPWTHTVNWWMLLPEFGDDPAKTEHNET